MIPEAKSKLTVNFEKTNIVVFNKNEKPNSNKLTIGPKTNESKDTAKYLGIHIDKELNFRKHFKTVKQKLQQITSRLFQLKRFLRQRTVVKLYKAHVQPAIHYGALIYGCATKTDLKDLEWSQNKILRIIFYLKKSKSLSDLKKINNSFDF